MPKNHNTEDSYSAKSSSKKTGSQSIQHQPQLNASSLLILITPPKLLVNFNILAGGGEQMICSRNRYIAAR